MVVITDEMKYAMDDDPVEFLGKFSTVFDCILTDRIHTDEEVSGKTVPFTIIEGDDVCEIIMLKIFLVDIKNIIVGTEDYGYVTDASYLALSDELQPTVIQGFSLENEISVFEIVRNHAKIFRKSNILYKKFEIKIIISNFTGQNGI